MCPTHGQAQFFRTEHRDDVGRVFSADFGVNSLEFIVEFRSPAVCRFPCMQEREDFALLYRNFDLCKTGFDKPGLVRKAQRACQSLQQQFVDEVGKPVKDVDGLFQAACENVLFGGGFDDGPVATDPYAAAGVIGKALATTPYR